MINRIFLFIVLVTAFSSCSRIDLYERVKPIPEHQWSSRFKPEFKFNITDTTSPYQLYVILRHNEKYNYNNIWLNIYTKTPGGANSSKATYELQLATNDKGWLGTGMDDIYEHRILLTPSNQNFYFKKAGTYSFTIEQIMREDPLLNVMDIGLRIERK